VGTLWYWTSTTTSRSSTGGQCQSMSRRQTMGSSSTGWWGGLKLPSHHWCITTLDGSGMDARYEVEVWDTN
jgi:hypothetical protein